MLVLNIYGYSILFSFFFLCILVKETHVNFIVIFVFVIHLRDCLSTISRKKIIFLIIIVFSCFCDHEETDVWLFLVVFTVLSELRSTSLRVTEFFFIIVYTLVNHFKSCFVESEDR